MLLTSSSPNSASRLLFYDRLDCFFPFSNSLEIGDIFPKHRPGNIVTFDIPHISKRKPFLTGYFSLLLNSSICFEISFCFLLYSVMYVVRCKNVTLCLSRGQRLGNSELYNNVILRGPFILVVRKSAEL